MNPSGLTSLAVVIMLFSSAPLLASCSQKSPSTESKMTRDELYQSVLQRLEALEEAWKQGPPNTAAAVDELRNALSQLQRNKTEAVPTSKTKTAPPPEGPFPPSQQPSPESEQEKRRKATEERFLSGGPLEKASLQGVPEEWILSSCDKAQAELTRFDELTRKTPVDRKAVEESLEKLASVIRGMPNPPPPK